MTELANFRTNLSTALEADERSLHQLHRDTGIGLAFLSRIKTGTTATGYGKPTNPSLETCERIASSLGYFVRELLLPPQEFRRLVKARTAANLAGRKKNP